MRPKNWTATMATARCGLVGVLCRPRDQPRRGADQPDVGGDGACAQQRGQDERARTPDAPWPGSGPAAPSGRRSSLVGRRRSWHGYHWRQMDDPVGEGQQRGPVGDDDHRTTHHQPPHSPQDAFLGPPVEIGRGLVEQQQRGVPHEGPSQGDPLALARETVRPRRGPGRCPDRREDRSTTSSRPASAMAARTWSSVAFGTTEPDIVGDGPGEQMRPLRHPGHSGAPERRGRDRPGRGSLP